jgi:signal transduction histidine kinase
MWTASSLSNRIFLACTLLATLSLGLAFSFVNASATREAEEDLRRRLQDAADLADQQRAALVTDTLTGFARLVADLPKLKAAVETADPPTVQPLAEDYRTQMHADLLVLYGKDGQTLGSVGAVGADLPAPPAADPGTESSMFLSRPRGLLQIVSVPIQVGVEPPELLGRLTAGFFLDHERALQFKRVIDSDIAFGDGRRILASSLPAETHAALRDVLDTRTITSVELAGHEYLALVRPMQAGGHAVRGGDTPMLIVLRSRSEQLRFLNTLRAGLGGALLVAVVLATLVSYGVARTITRPLAAVTSAMADVAATGDLTRRVAVQSRAWDDEDARLLGTAFNTLTESIARFRREEAQRERLSALGRLSTVVAHEIRNPLMIISASLRTLRRDRVGDAERREAVQDIDEETARLNRLVTDVLDFARPLRFELAEADLNELCRAAATAAATGDAFNGVQLDLDPSLPPIVTDAERLRTVLVNVLLNARAAVHARPEPQPAGAVAAAGSAGAVAAAAGTRAGEAAVAALAGAAITLRTKAGAGGVAVIVSDRGIGISSDDMAHIFDPYFTTRRAGTGLGLPIARNIVEGLGGTIAVSSEPGSGTEIRIDLPVIPVERPV